MPTKNPRTDITFDETVVTLLTQLASQKNRSIPSIANELVLEALERRENIALSKIAEIRDKSRAKMYSHHNAWE